MKGYLFQCVLSNDYLSYHKLSVRVRHCMGIFRLTVYDIDSVQVLLDVRNRRRHGILQFFCLSVLLW